jgi:hypothetical protein
VNRNLVGSIYGKSSVMIAHFATNLKQWQSCLLMDQNDMSNRSYHLAKRFQRKSCFRNLPIRNKNCLWRLCLLTDQNGMSNSYRGPSIDASNLLLWNRFAKWTETW